MQFRDIKRLLDAVAEADLSEFSLETSDYKLSLKRLQNGAIGTQVSLAPAGAQPASQPAALPPVQNTSPPAAETVAATAAEPAAGATSGLVDVTAPIVGTFYAAPAPDAPDYVKVGDRVSRGSVLCIIEAMKLMNEIESETEGVVAEVLVRNEDPVEYGQVLFRIQPT